MAFTQASAQTKYLELCAFSKEYVCSPDLTQSPNSCHGIRKKKVFPSKKILWEVLPKLFFFSKTLVARIFLCDMRLNTLICLTRPFVPSPLKCPNFHDIQWSRKDISKKLLQWSNSLCLNCTQPVCLDRSLDHRISGPNCHTFSISQKIQSMEY